MTINSNRWNDYEKKIILQNYGNACLSLVVSVHGDREGAIASLLFIFVTILLQIEAFVTTTQRYTSYRVVDV
jgi:hypothetical protein